MKFIPPEGGCTICSDKDLGGNKRNDIKKATVYSLQQFSDGETIKYDLYAYGTECPLRKLTENTGNSIIVGSGMK